MHAVTEYPSAISSMRRDKTCECGEVFRNGKAYKTHLDNRCPLQQGVQRSSVLAAAPRGSGSHSEPAASANSAATAIQTADDEAADTDAALLEELLAEQVAAATVPSDINVEVIFQGTCAWLLAYLQDQSLAAMST
jgi:hypothetical protein